MASEPDYYRHCKLNEAVPAIGGHYVLTEEKRLSFEGQEVLYCLGYAVIDTSCCGAGGCAFVLVRGYVVAWKKETDHGGRPVSIILAVEDKDEQERIRRMILDKEPARQVNFF